MKYVFGIVGRARSGKDTVANRLAVYFKSVELLYEATALKEQAIEELGIKSIEELDNYKNSNTPYKGINIRKYIQSLADKTKKQYGDDYYRNILVDKINKSKAKVIIIPDMRFSKTDKLLRDTFDKYVTFKVVRRDVKIKESNHNSETEIDNMNTNYVITNNSTIEDLYYVIHNNLNIVVSMDQDILKEIK